MSSNLNNTSMGLFFDLMVKMDKSTPEERERLWSDLMTMGKQAKEEFEQLSQEFSYLKEKNAALEELYLNLDKQRSLMTPGDYEQHRLVCQEMYKQFWNELDEKSREFFTTAHYIFESVKSRKSDFSPVIIEFCRIFENELQARIYIDFIDELCSKEEQVLDGSDTYKHLQKAVRDNIERGSYFLSATDMIKYLGMMRSGNKINFGYNYELKSFLKRRGSDISKLSDAEFEAKSLAYINDFRNEAAHPNMLNENVADKCKEKTKKIIRQFIQYS